MTIQRMRRSWIGAVIVALALLWGCQTPGAVTADRDAAVTATEEGGLWAADAEPSASEEGQEELKINPERSTIAFVGQRTEKNHVRSLPEMTGEVVLRGGDLHSLWVEVDMKALVGDDAFSQHLRSTDFLDVERYPTARFTSSEVAPATADDGRTHMIKGTMEVKGVKLPVTFPAQVQIGDEGVHAETTLTLDRLDFMIDIAYGPGGDPIARDVPLVVTLDCPR